jgi:hypothetical protein
MAHDERDHTTLQILPTKLVALDRIQQLADKNHFTAPMQIVVRPNSVADENSISRPPKSWPAAAGYSW